MNRRTFFGASSSFALAAILGAFTTRSVFGSSGTALRPLKTPTALNLTPRGLERQRMAAGGAAIHQFPAVRPLRPYYAPRANRVIRKKTGRRM